MYAGNKHNAMHISWVIDAHIAMLAICNLVELGNHQQPGITEKIGHFCDDVILWYVDQVTHTKFLFCLMQDLMNGHFNLGV